MKVNTTNPATEQVLQEYDVMSKNQVNEIVKNSKEVFGQWKKDIHKRIELVHNFANELRKNKTVLAKTATNETEKTLVNEAKLLFANSLIEVDNAED